METMDVFRLRATLSMFLLLILFQVLCLGNTTAYVQCSSVERSNLPIVVSQDLAKSGCGELCLINEIYVMEFTGDISPFNISSRSRRVVNYAGDVNPINVDALGIADTVKSTVLVRPFDVAVNGISTESNGATCTSLIIGIWPIDVALPAGVADVTGVGAIWPAGATSATSVVGATDVVNVIGTTNVTGGTGTTDVTGAGVTGATGVAGAGVTGATSVPGATDAHNVSATATTGAADAASVVGAVIGPTGTQRLDWASAVRTDARADSISTAMNFFVAFPTVSLCQTILKQNANNLRTICHCSYKEREIVYGIQRIELLSQLVFSRRTNYGETT